MAEDDDVQERVGHPHVRRVFLAVTASLSAFVMVLGVAGMGTYFWTRAQIRTIPDVVLPPVTESGATSAAEQEPIGGRCVRGVCHYLLLGSDSRQGLSKEEQIAFGTDADIGGENRSDTIILVHTDPEQQEAVFLSFPRDLWVEIPGQGSGKINSSFEGGIEGGGAQRVARTVKNLTGLPIHHVMYVDLAGFQGLVDALDGVEMCVPYPMQDPLTSLDIPAGCQHFDGETALAYVRTRHQPCDTIPDFARIGRQQQFLRAVVSKLLSPSELLRLPALVPELLGNLVVDKGLKNPAELAYLAGQLNGVNTGAADFRSVPTVPAGTYVNGQYLSIVRAVQPAADQLFQRLREGGSLGQLGLELPQTPPSPANIAVDVYDRDSLGQAFEVQQTLVKGGFLVTSEPRDISELGTKAKGSVILFAPGEEERAKVVASYVPGLRMEPAPKRVLGGADVAVVIDQDYDPVPLEEQAPQTEADCP